VVALALGLGLWMRRSRTPARPPGVPAAAEWAGRGASGRFFLVEGRDGTVWRIRVYAAQEGRPEAATRWRLVGFARTALEAHEIAGLEDGAIRLEDGSRLLPAP
jgi:hypothetical protein